MKFLRRAAHFAAFLFLCILASSVSGFPLRTANAEEATSLGEISVKGSSEPISEDQPSAFVSVINPKPFENQVKTLPELLSMQPGVHVQQFGGLGQFSTISIRGSTAEQVTVLVDGVRINTAQGGAVDFSTIPLDAIDRIEVIRGGASAQYGSDAIGGVVNILTKRSKKKQSFEGAMGIGSFGTFKSTEGYSRRFKKWALLFDHTHFQSNGDFTFVSTPSTIGGVTVGGGKEFVRENNSFFSENGLLKLEGDPSQKIHLSLTTDWFGTQRQVPPTEDEQILLSPTNPPEAHENVLKNNTTFSTEIRSVGLKGLDLQIQPFYHYEWSHFEDPSPAIGGAIDVKYYNQSFGGRMAWRYLFKTGSVLQTFKLNYDIRRDLFHDKNLITSTAVAGHHSRTTNGLYVSDELSLFNERLFFNPSLRFEHASDFGSRVALHFGAMGHPTRWMTLKTNIENSFRYPNFNELFLPNEGIIKGNPNLSPEKAINFDVGMGFHHRYGHHEISYFLNRIDNSIIFVPISAFTIAPLNTRRVNAQGIEVSTSLSPWSHLDIDGNYTLLLAHLVGTSDQLPGRPRHKANLKLTLKNNWGSVWASLQYIDRLPIDFANTTFIKSRAQVDIGGSLRLFKNYYFALEVKDVTNTQILDARGFPLPRLSVLGSLGVRI
ncbi:MAG: TonB-dependent receptor [bacterium]